MATTQEYISDALVSALDADDIVAAKDWLEALVEHESQGFRSMADRSVDYRRAGRLLEADAFFYAACRAEDDMEHNPIIEGLTVLVELEEELLAAMQSVIVTDHYGLEPRYKTFDEVMGLAETCNVLGMPMSATYPIIDSPRPETLRDRVQQVHRR